MERIDSTYLTWIIEIWNLLSISLFTTIFKNWTTFFLKLIINIFLLTFKNLKSVIKMDWNNIADKIFLWYNKFIEWYLVQPNYGQILVIIGIVALLAILITLVYYLIKGISYLVYYAIKGVYYLLKGVGFGFYKLCEGFYYLISGEPKPKKQKQNLIPQMPNGQSEEPYRLMEIVQHNIIYCNECGNKFSEKMHNNLKINGIAFCVHCGKRFELNETLKHTISIYP